MSRRYRFPHSVSRFTVTGRDGQEYTVTLAWYTAVLRTPQQVFMSMLIEGPNGYRREILGDRQIRPVMERLRAQAHASHTVDFSRQLSEKMCDLCRQEIRKHRSDAKDG